MAFHVKNPETDALARELSKLRGSGLTDAVHFALAQAIAVEKARASLPEIAVGVCRELKAAGRRGD